MDPGTGSVREWLTATEAAKRINVSSSYIRRAIYSKRLTAKNISLGAERAEWRIAADDLDRFMKETPPTEGGAA
jgi:excisionase family DNA binding protein